MAGPPGVSGLEDRYRRVSETGDPPAKLAGLIDFEILRPPPQRDTGREEGALTEGLDPGGSGGEACQARAEGRRRALDAEASQGAQGRGQIATDRSDEA